MRVQKGRNNRNYRPDPIFLVTVDASALPIGWGAGLNPQTDSNTDNNEGTDHHLIDSAGTLRSSGLITLSASVNGVGLIDGDEPLGENVKILGDPLVRDDMTNFSLDLMLSPERGSIEVQKTLEANSGGTLDGWQFTIASTQAIDCPLPVTNFSNPLTTDDQGVVTFPDLLVYGISSGARCDYTISETALQSGWFLASQSPAGPHQVSDGGTTSVTILNEREKPELVLEKVALDQGGQAVQTVNFRGEFVYRLTVRNEGLADATGVVVRDPFPAGMVHISNDVGATLSGSTLIWPVGDLAVGQTREINITVRVDQY